MFKYTGDIEKDIQQFESRHNKINDLIIIIKIGMENRTFDQKGIDVAFLTVGTVLWIMIGFIFLFK